MFVGSKPSLGLLFVRKILPFDVLRYNEMLLALLSKNYTEVVSMGKHSGLFVAIVSNDEKSFQSFRHGVDDNCFLIIGAQVK